MNGNHVLIALLLLGGCAEPARDAPAAERGGLEPAVPTAADSARAIEEGGAVATAVAQGLAQRLQARLRADGAAGAVDFCARTALALTDSLLAAHPQASAVRRTASRIRNPQNAPDEHERAALAWFDSVRAATGALPAAHVQAVGADEIRFYRPLVIAAFCTECHGAPGLMDPEVVRIIAARYPVDQATGYREGDMRGVIRVSLPRTGR